MPKYNTYDFDWIEFVPPSSLELQQKIQNILWTSEDCSAKVVDLNLATGEFQVTLQGKLKPPVVRNHC